MADDLNWGETPFDHMTPEAVLLNAKRMYSALVTLRSLAKQLRLGNEQSPFWSIGVGGSAIEKGEQAYAAVTGGFTEENIYRSYYRYADDLLFDTSKHPMIGSGWYVCATDGQMIGRSLAGDPPSSCRTCGGPMRPLIWDDLNPGKATS